MSQNAIFVGNLAYEVTEEELAAAFSNCGRVLQVHIMKDRSTGRSKGVGTLTFEYPTSATAAVQSMDGADLKGRSMRLRLDNDNDDAPAKSGGPARSSAAPMRSHPYAPPMVPPHSGPPPPYAPPPQMYPPHPQPHVSVPMMQPAMTPLPPTPPPVLPQPWRQELDPGSGRAFFHNPSTGESYWARLLLEP
eukprot:1848369-Prymnesium_polylepis.1